MLKNNENSQKHVCGVFLDLCGCVCFYNSVISVDTFVLKVLVHLKKEQKISYFEVSKGKILHMLPK